MIDKEYNYEYIVNCNYDSYNDCENNGCIDEGICRCGVISNQHVSSVDINLISKNIYDQYFDNDLSNIRDEKLSQILDDSVGKDINLYTIDRILRHFKIWKNNCWYIEVKYGYYGEEVTGVFFEKNTIQKIENKINEAFSITSLTERVKYLIILEYKRLLPEISNSKFELITLPVNSLEFGSKTHYGNVNKEDLSHYRNYDGIMGLVTKKTNDKYRIIDGYHRLSVAVNMKSNDVKLILAT